MDDFDRNAWCLLGLPFDAVTMDETIERIHHAVRSKEKCFISTPNLNFLIASQKDPDFRNSVINSDLSVADGKPLIWLARMLNIPLPERVAGSDIIERLIENREGKPSIKVFFFGGQDGIAEQACNKLNAMNKGLKCVGFHNPGFGSIEQMSTPEIINTINQSDADFVIVSLGAKKGQAWIQANNDKLDAPVISHLGAVVNFVAGNVKRSPKFIQIAGLEWLWRIKEEPSLWKRYLYDGLNFLGLFIVRIIPYSIIVKLNAKNSEPLIVDINDDPGVVTIKMTGFATDQSLDKYDNTIVSIIKEKPIHIDLGGLDYCDASFIARLIFLTKSRHYIGYNVSVSSPSNRIRKILRYNACIDVIS